MTDENYLKWNPPPMDIAFCTGGGPIVTFHADGRITVADHAKADEAARLFLQTLAQQYPLWLRDPDNG